MRRDSIAALRGVKSGLGLMAGGKGAETRLFCSVLYLAGHATAFDGLKCRAAELRAQDSSVQTQRDHMGECAELKQSQYAANKQLALPGSGAAGAEEEARPSYGALVSAGARSFKTP